MRSILFVALVAGVVACGDSSPAPASREPLKTLELPAPDTDGDRSLEAILASRRSSREFSEKKLSRATIGQLAWATQGVTSPEGGRTSPSAGSLYPLELYVATVDGIFRYVPGDHALELLDDRNLRAEIHAACKSQQVIRDAAAVFVLSAIYARTNEVYKGGRAPVFVHVEAGHAAQNFLLQAAALGLAACPIGGFDSKKLQQIMGMGKGEYALYALPVGHPQEP